ncbi:MAG: respiratory chain complex I subunit 1 family protein [Burkholderiaceae bacterium]|jgi:hydrogenase-4 component C|nr:respiratory chain complex I subunit 1 family protein [Burkholderiaceae bacterium]
MPDMGFVLLAVIQAFVLLLAAPVFTGISRVMRAKMHSRRGPGIFQDYRDLIKLMKRQDVAPAASGLMFRIMPYELLGSVLLIAMVVPAVSLASPLGVAGDLIAIAYVLAFSRFIFASSALETESPYAGIGAGRESSLGVLVEPIMILSLLVAALANGSTNIGAIGTAIAENRIQTPVAMLLAFVAFGFAVYIEMGKLPFDLAEAEQELQEGPLTEYSGQALAVLKWGLATKKMVMAALFVSVFIPYGNAADLSIGSIARGTLLFFIKVLAIYILAALVENSMARGRFLLTSRVTWVGFGMALLSLVFYLAGL